jgi:ATP-dependent Clp protease ATP-binding subunit ClpA
MPDDKPENGTEDRVWPVLPLTPATRAAIILGEAEATAEGAHSVRPEHVLLGLLRDQGSDIAPLLEALGLDSEKVREEIRKLRGEGS